jgi:hypothetical protein
MCSIHALPQFVNGQHALMIVVEWLSLNDRWLKSRAMTTQGIVIDSAPFKGGRR